MRLTIDNVTDSAPLPEQTDVAIIGGGIAGICTAWFLAKAGVRVAVLEKGQVAAEQSCRNWGFCRQQGRDVHEIPLIKESLALWRQMDELTGEKTGFRQTGILYLARDKAMEQGYRSWLERAAPYELDSHLVTAAEVSRLFPAARGSWPMALHTPSDGRAEPFQAVPAIARSAQRFGASIHQRCAVRGIETSAGRISGVVTEKGEIKASSVVVAGGAWSRLFLGSLGINLPQLTLLSSVMRTASAPDVGDMALWESGFSLRRRDDGGYTIARGSASLAELTPDNFRLIRQFWPAFRAEKRALHMRLGKRFVQQALTPARWNLDGISPFEKIRVYDPEPYHPMLDAALKALAQVIPQLANVSIEQRWAGYIDVTPDAVPVISPVEEKPGLYISTGYSGHGFGLGPGAGRLMSELVRGDTTCVDPRPFRFSRFSDGTPITISSAI